jgi:hypothetical protein
LLNRGADIRVIKLERQAGIRRHLSLESIVTDLTDEDLSYALDRVRGHDPKPDREDAFRQLLADCTRY